MSDVVCLFSFFVFFLSMAKGTLRCTRKFPGETVSGEDTSTGVNEFGLEKKPEVVADKEDNFTSEAQDAVEEKLFTSEAQSEDEHTQASLEFFNDIKVFSLHILLVDICFEF